MKVKDLIGKVILDIKSEITDYEYDGSIPLEHSDSIIVLENEKFIRIPDKFDIELDDEVEIVDIISEKHQSLFNTNERNNVLSQLKNVFSKNENNKIIDKNKENIVNKVITGILVQGDDSATELDKCVLEIDNNYLISEIVIAPNGTGHTGIWIFTSKTDLYRKFGDNFLNLKTN